MCQENVMGFTFPVLLGVSANTMTNTHAVSSSLLLKGKLTKG